MELHLRTLVFLVLSLLGSIGLPVAVAHWPSTAPVVTAQTLPTPTPVPLRSDVVTGSTLAQSLLRSTARPTAQPSAVTQPVFTGIVATNGVNLNIRSGPGLTYAVVGSAPPGMTLTLTGLSLDGQWLRIQLPDYAGPTWVYAPLVDWDRTSLRSGR